MKKSDTVIPAFQRIVGISPTHDSEQKQTFRFLKASKETTRGNFLRQTSPEMLEMTLFCGIIRVKLLVCAHFRSKDQNYSQAYTLRD